MKRLLIFFLIICAVLQLSACNEQASQTSSDTEASKEESVLTGVTNDSSKEESSEEESSEEESITESSVEESSEPEDLTFDITLSFTGDMILASNLNQTTGGSFNEYAENNPPEYFLSKVKDIFTADDFTIVNLENVLSDKDLTPIEKDYEPAFWFISKASNVEILSTAGVEGVTLSNNHTGDYGHEGFKETADAVVNAGMQYGDNAQIMYFEKNGFTVAVICAGMWSGSGANSIINNYMSVAEANSDYQVVFFHGGTEKIHEPEEWKREGAKKMVDAGADLVVGSHPHVLQPREVYNGVEIVYSLGNFCYGGHRSPENRTIIYQMKLTIDENLQVEASESNIIPCYVYTAERNNYQPTPITDEDEIQKVLDFMDWKTDSPK